MSQENVEIVRRVLEASAHRDAKTVFSLFDPEAEWENSRGPFKDLIGAGIYHGHEGLRHFWHEYYAEAWETVEDNLEELIDVGDCVVSVVIPAPEGGRAGSRLSGLTTRASGPSARAS